MIQMLSSRRVLSSRRIAIVLSAAAFCFSFASATHADTLELKNGSIVRGKFVGGSEFNVRFMVSGAVKYYSTKDILTLTFDSSEPAQPAPQAAPAPAPANPQPAAVAATNSQSSSITIPAGTTISIRMIDSVDSSTNQVGDQFHASLESDLIVNNVVIAPKGADVYGKLEQVHSAGSIKGQSQLQLGLTGIRINGAIVPITTGDYEVAGASRSKQSAERIGGVAALGAVIGAIAGGGKGAAIGAGAGAGVGTAVQVATRGQQVRVPSETVLDFKLQSAFSVPAH
ncbi:MAG TPA: hypothetical protein VFU57_08250 [Candidatus Acidoferrales bacterium]|nr:hypothetical protein [Candidatus Acidoferrales bacterium]